MSRQDPPVPTEMETGMRARELSLWASSDCDRVRALGSVGSSGRQAAAWFEQVDAYAFEASTSRFAAEAGFTHESSLLLNQAAHLRRLYEEVLGLVISEDGCDFLISQDPLAVLRGESISAEDEELARERTRSLISECVRGEHLDPVLIAQARVWVQVDKVKHLVKPDVLVWTGTQFRVGEMKAYIDRGGYTDESSVGSAVRQAAASVIGLRQMVAAAGAADPEALVCTDVDLLFRRRRGGGASLRVLSAVPEVESLTGAIRSASADRSRFLEMTGGVMFDRVEVLRRIPLKFTAQCRESCGLADLCEQEQAVDPSARYGAAVSELAAIGVTPHRAGELAAGATPVTVGERRAAYALSAAWTASNIPVVKTPVDVP